MREKSWPSPEALAKLAQAMDCSAFAFFADFSVNFNLRSS
jgi:hypothetical protein